MKAGWRPIAGIFVVGLVIGLWMVLTENSPLRADGDGKELVANRFYAMGNDGHQRIQLGSYEAGSEMGQPVMAMFDNQRRIRFLIRLAGANDAPVLVFKDKSGKDRMVIGLGMNDADENPFLAWFDKEGKKHMEFGSY